MKIIKKQVTKNNKEYINFYLVNDNGYKIAIKPSFRQGFYELNAFAELVEDKK